MNLTVTLVNEWAAFEAKYPDGTLEDFCRYYLTKKRVQPVKGKMVGGVVPPFTDGLLLKILGRITKLNMSYANLALKGTDVNQLEEFGMLATIMQEVSPRKTDVIQSNLLELSSGTDMLNRLKSRGLISESIDKDDKRAKRVELTAKGKKVTEQSYVRITKNARMLTNNLTHDDKELCVQLLRDIEIKFSELWPGHKAKSFDEIYSSIIGVGRGSGKGSKDTPTV